MCKPPRKFRRVVLELGVVLVDVFSGQPPTAWIKRPCAPACALLNAAAAKKREKERKHVSTTKIWKEGRAITFHSAIRPLSFCFVSILSRFNSFPCEVGERFRGEGGAGAERDFGACTEVMETW